MEAASAPAQPSIVRRGFDPVVHGLLIGFLAALAVIPIEIRSLFGLPAHPLLLHAPVVLIPLLGIAAIALVIRRDWLTRYGVALAIGAIVTLGATNLAVGAGEAFREARDNAMTSSTLTAPAGESGETGESGEPGGAPSGEEGEDQQLDEHAELGDQLRIVMILFAGAIVLLVAADQARRRGTEGPIGRAATALASRRIDLALKAAVGILAAVAIVWVVRTGHEGAKVAWSEEPGFGNQDSPPAGVAPPYGEPGE